MDDPVKEPNLASWLDSVQIEISELGLWSAGWIDGMNVHLIASTDPQWVDARMHAIASPIVVINWVPAVPNR